MKALNKILIISLLTLVFSCEKTVYVEVPDNDPKLVTQTFLTTDDVEKEIKLALTWSVPLYSAYDYSFKDEKDADVYIIKNGQKHKLTYTNPSPMGGTNGYYKIQSSSVGVKTGDSFSLEIETRDKKTKITSQTTVPDKPVYSLSYENKTVNEYNENTYSFVFKSLNNNDINYYFFICKGYFTRQPGNIIDSVNMYSFSETNYYKIAKGNSAILSFVSYDEVDSVKIKVFHTDEAYYLYNSSVYNFEGDNPFSEPSPIYSNIDGGLGVFCSYNTDYQILKVK